MLVPTHTVPTLRSLPQTPLGGCLFIEPQASHLLLFVFRRRGGGKGRSYLNTGPHEIHALRRSLCRAAEKQKEKSGFAFTPINRQPQAGFEKPYKASRSAVNSGQETEKPRDSEKRSFSL